ncbi:MAG: sigma 54-interacting transcriptional regulator [Desulfatiglandaceae bacterium]|jgi:transcriptional regulator with PAS, ATPase and Fis domain
MTKGTEKGIKEVALLQKPDFFKMLLDNMQVGVIVSDSDGRIVYINETYARFLEMSPAAQIGKHATELGVNSRLHVVAKTGRAEVNYPHQFKDRAFLVHRVPIREKGEVIAVLGLVLFDSASTASKLAEKVSFLESKVDLYENELISLRSTKYTFDSIVGKSSDMKELKRHARKAAATDLPVVITGESGTGKELFAQAIHHASARRPFPFIRINCSAIPRDLLESELFGYEKGAFTGAKTKGKPGKFELAHHGTLFLDEIGDLPLQMQPKLLRVLEEKEFERIGGTQVIKSDFRLIAATNQNLEEMLTEGRFREDLFYRLNVIPIEIPPLRKRKEDILHLTNHLLARAAQHWDLPMLNIDSRAEKALIEYAWPGNVRELSNTLERVLSYLEGSTIHLCDLPFYLHRSSRGSERAGRAGLKTVQRSAEREAIRYALESSEYNKAKAAKLLGIHRSVLYKKLKRYNIPLNNP